MRRWMVAVLGLLMVFALVGCAPEEPGRSLTAVGIDTCTGVVTDRFLRGDGEVLVTCIEVDTGSGEPRLFALPEAVLSGSAGVHVGDTVRVESNLSDDPMYRPALSVEVTIPRLIQSVPPYLTVSVSGVGSVEPERRDTSWWWYTDEGDLIWEACNLYPPVCVEKLPLLELSPDPAQVELWFESVPDEMRVKFLDADERCEDLTAAFDEALGCFSIQPPAVSGVYEIYADWKDESRDYGGTVWYGFRTASPAHTS